MLGLLRSHRAASRAAALSGLLASRLAALVLAWPALALAQPADAPPGFQDLDHTIYGALQGAPTAVNALAQAPDGFLWIGTSEGLYRFDGSHFQRHRLADGRNLPDADVTALLARPSGELWAATRFGHLYRIDARGTHLYGPESGLPAHAIFGITADATGEVWIGSSYGVFRRDGEHWTEVRARDGSTLHILGAQALSTDAQGRVWAVSTDSGVFCREPGAASFDKRREPSEISGNLFAGPRGDAWIADAQGVSPLAGATPGIDARTLARLGGDRRGVPVMRYLDRQGVLWGYSNGRLLRMPCDACMGRPGRPPALERFPADRELSGTDFVTFLEDREGDVWVGGNGGLDRFRPNRFRQALVDGRPLADVALATTADGTLFAGTHATGLYRRTASGAFVQEPFGTPDDNFISALYGARDGTLWIGGDGELFRSVAGGYRRVPFPAAEADNFEVQSFAEDDDGGLWVAAALSGLYRLADGRWRRNGGVAGLPDVSPLVLRASPDTGLWLGYVDDLVFNLQGGQLRRFGAAQGLAVGNVLSVLPDGPRTWIGGTTGVALVSGARARALLGPGGEPFTGVSGIVRTPDGDLWLNGAEGATHIAARALQSFLAGTGTATNVEQFGAHAGVVGLPQNLRPLPTAALTRDGQLWLATTSGLFHAEPGRLARNEVRPQVSVQAVRAGGRPVAAGSRIELAAGVRTLEFDYTATSLAAPELVRFRYRLDGVDAGWQDAGNRRQAFYTNLAPGDYVFRVAATNEDGLSSGGDATVSISNPPAFWQTGWFTAACLALLAALGWTLHRVRLGVLSQRVRTRYESRLQERERIARELHDTLLQGTQGLVLGVQVAACKLARTDPCRIEMERVLDQADQVVAEARDRVHDLRNPAESEEGLATALAAVGADLAAHARAGFEVDIDADLPPLRDDMSSEAFMAAREALINAFRHARATLIRLEVRCDARLLRVVVRDDGSGIDAAVLARGHRPGHWGLVGMRERVEKLGGRLHLHSESGRGTAVTFSWPLRVVAATPRGRIASRLGAWLRRRRAAGASDAQPA